MKKILAALYPENTNSLVLFILRLGLGILTMHHGYQKLTHFGQMKSGFPEVLGLSSAASLAIAMVVEFFGSIFIMLGLLTRVAAVPLTITMAVALFKIKEGDIFGGGESAALYLLGYLCLFLAGAGIMSLDSVFAKKTRTKHSSNDGKTVQRSSVNAE